MGRDSQPRIRQKEKLERKAATRPTYNRILIVCEGTKTEPGYFSEIRKYYRLSGTHIRIMPADGTTPMQVVHYAEKELKKTYKWEQVFCVFDRDDHHNFNNALYKAEALNKKFKNEEDDEIEFKAIVSNPCFELWLLLHFIPVTKETHRNQVSHLLRHTTRLPKYEKAKDGFFAKTREKLHIAFDNAKRLSKDPNQNPHTSIGQIVESLINLREHKD